MSRRHMDKPNIKWTVGDVREMTQIADAIIDVAFNKGTLDAMVSSSLWDPPDMVKTNIKRYVDEVFGFIPFPGLR